MSRIIAFSTGSIFRWEGGTNGQIDYVRQFGADGIEITFGRKLDLYNFQYNKSQIEWIKGLDYRSIHSPFRLVHRADNVEEIKRQLELLKEAYDAMGAENIVIHPNELPPYPILKEYGMNICTENLPPASKIQLPYLERILDEHQDFGLCLDVAHAFLVDKYETKRIIDKFGERIIQIHLSGTKDGRDHLTLQQVDYDFIESIQPIKELDVPIVIEENFKKKDLDYVKREIEYVRSLFG